MDNIDLVKHLKNIGVLESEGVIRALKKIDRSDFVGESNSSIAYFDEALPIGKGQTISQPQTVVFMLELLNVQEGQDVMDVGSGSGWQSALLAEIVGSGGSVHAVELIPELCSFGQENVNKYPEIKNRITFYCKNAQEGLARISDEINGFDRIICAAEVGSLPEPWKDQLKVGGVIVYPKDKGIYKERKRENNTYEKNFYPGFSFVPFIKG